MIRGAAARALRWHERPVPHLLRAMWRESALSAAGVWALVLVATGLALCSVVAGGQLIGKITLAVRGDQPDAQRAAWLALVALAAVLVAQQVVTSLLWPLLAAVGRRVEGRVRSDVMRSVLNRPDIAHLSDAEIRDAIGAATTVGTARYGPSFAVEGLATVAGGLLSGTAMAVLLSLYRWWLGPLLVAVWLLARVFVHRERMELLAVYAQQAEATRRFGYYRDLALQPLAAKEIRVFGLHAWLVEGFLSYWGTAMHRVWDQQRRKLTPLARLTCVVVAVHLVAVLVVVRGFDSGEIDVGELVILLQALIGTSAINLADAGNGDAHVEWGGSTVIAADRLRERLPVSAGAAGTALAPRAEIRFEGLGFRYPNGPRDVLSDMDLRIEVGKSLAIVGENGAGKTTVVKLLAGLLPPDTGRVTVDGRDLAGFDLEDWHRRFAAVLQDYIRLPATLRDNVTLGRYGPDDAAALADIARRTRLDRVVDQLPLGWDTPAGRDLVDGTELSGGQWQRVALARALWSVHCGATVLVLDEPTSALDVRAEAAFYDDFLDLTRDLTTIVISHRYSTVRRADRIAVLGAGGVTEVGSHDELIRRDGTYAQYFRLQAGVFETTEAVDADR
ncbi:ABC transporter ATP-binding protein [Nocardia wallacei]|uniref:ABC transporter ATP-binding protein n=1 Tax=Nocardia wallacei TaxID=480035 RepID=UPI002453D7BF|nr:ABC transporter ATP-binding protein [Nocardia wallacei]